MTIRELITKINFEISDEQLKKADVMLNGLIGRTRQLGVGLEALAFKMSGVAHGAQQAFSMLMQNFISEPLKAYAELEQLNRTFMRLFKTRAEGEQFLKLMEDMSKEMSFTDDSVKNAGKTLVTFGMPLADIQANMKMIGNVAAGVGTSLESVAAIYGRVQMMGQLDVRTLRMFMAERIPIVKALSESLGITEEQVYALAKKGKISAEQVKKAFEFMTSAGGLYADAMKEQNNTVAGSMMKLRDAQESVRKSLGGLIVRELHLVGIFRTLGKWINTFSDWLKKQPKWVRMAIAGTIAFSLALAGLVTVGTQVLSLIASLALALPLLGTIGTMIATAWTVAIAPLLEFVAVATILWLIIDDIYHWIKGDKTTLAEKIFGDFQPIKTVLKDIADVWDKFTKSLMSGDWKPFLESWRKLWDDAFVIFDNFSKNFGEKIKSIPLLGTGIRLWEQYVEAFGTMHGGDWRKGARQLGRTVLESTGILSEYGANVVIPEPAERAANQPIPPMAFEGAVTGRPIIKPTYNITQNVPAGTPETQAKWLKDVTIEMFDTLSNQKYRQLFVPAVASELMPAFMR